MKRGRMHWTWVALGIGALAGGCKKNEAAPVDAGVVDAAADAAIEVDAGASDASADAAPVHAGPLALPGACVDPMADAASRGGAATVSSEPDLDGDGVKDRILVQTHAPKSTFLLYVMRGACGHFVGKIDAGTATADKARTHGVANVHGHVPCAGAAKCNCTEQDFDARYDGHGEYFQGPMTEQLVQCGKGQKPF